MDLKDRIRFRREAIHATLEDIAKEVGVSKTTVQRWESGVIANMRRDKIDDLASALQTTPAYIMGWTDDPYDYDADPDNRIDSIPPAIYRHLQDTYRGDLEAIWRAYCAMDEDAKEQAAKDNSLQGILAIPNIEPMPQLREIPLLGSIACGEPILAQENIEEQLVIPAHIHADFALRCKGDSMVNARIYDGDIVYIRQQPDVEDGEIAAVLIDDEATLKRVYKFAGRVQLRAENPRYRPMEYSAEDYKTVRVLGKAVAFTAPVI